MVRTPFRQAMLIAWIVLLCGVGGALAQVPQSAPVNPDYLAAHSRARTRTRTLGYRPSPANWSHLTGQRVFRSVRAGVPSSYDLRALGRVSTVKDQGSSGCCWAFGTLASLESCLLPGQTANYSENNMKNLHGFDLDPNTGGGNREMATAYLARWGGPINESDDPYNPLSTTSNASLTVRQHIQHVSYLPDRASSTDNATIKQAIITYGAVATTMYWDDSYYRSATSSFYNPTVTSSNHLVAIVGWDDAYPASNFPTNPGMNGAFLVKNSWGTFWGTGGYFYISYADKAVGKANSVFYNAESTSNYTRVYQYDTLGQTSAAGYGSTSAWMANVFTAAASESIKAVALYAFAPNTTYQLSCYLNPSSGPLAGSAAVTQSGTITEPGYHTITLATPLSVTAGQQFSIVVNLVTPGYTFPLPIERPFAGYSSRAVASAGQSYISANGTTWSDLSTVYANTNVCLKAFAGTGGGVGSSLTAATLTTDIASPQPVNTAVTLTGGNVGGVNVEYKFEVLGNSWSTLRDYATGTTTTWAPNAAGSYTLRVSVRDADLPSVVVTKTLTYTITSALSAVTLAASPASPQTTGKAITLTATKTGGAAVQYQFSTSSNGGSTWTVAQAWSTASTCVWTPATVGTWQHKVAAREGASGTPVESTVFSYVIAPAPPTKVTLAAGVASPQPANVPITLTATATGGSIVEYKFAATSGGITTLLRDYATSATCSWTPAAAGSYTLSVSARESTLPATVVSGTLTYTIVAALRDVTLTFSLAAPQPVSKTIRLTATKTGGASVQYQFSASGDGGGTWSVLQAWSTTSTKDWTPTTAATWQVKVAAREGATGTPIESSVQSYLITPASPTAVALAASPATPQVVNTAVTLTAKKTGGTNVEYKYSATPTGGTPVTVSDWSTSTTATWTPATAGSYILGVSARESALPAVVIQSTQSYTVVPVLSAVTLAISPVAPQPVSKTLKLATTKTGGASVQYQFSASSDGGGTWNIVQAWSTTASKDWTPTTSATWRVKVAAREGASGTPIESAVQSYLITPAPPTAVSLVPSPASPQVVNTAVTLTAKVTGGSAVEYKFAAGPAGGTLTPIGDWSSTATATWTPASAGSYTLSVSAREAALPATVISGTLGYTVTPVLSAVTLAISPVAPQPVSKSLKLTATKTGGASVQYQFSASSDGGGTWNIVQAWSTTASKDWTPTTSATWRVKVAAREGTTGTPIESSVQSYLITPAPPTAVSLVPSPVSPQVVNTAITLTAKVTGGSSVEYKFAAGPAGGTLTPLGDWSTTATTTWTPASAGSYTLSVSAREAALPTTVISGTLGYTVTPVLSAVTLAISPVAPQPVSKALKLAATKTGGASVQYQFSASSDGGGTWNVLQAWSTTTTKDWMPTTAAAWRVKVAAREGATGTPIESAVQSYLITPAPPSAVSLTTSLASPQVVNTAVTLTVTKSGGTTVEYKFTVTPSSGTAVTLQDWSTTATARWTPAVAGSYTLAVAARESALPGTIVQQTKGYTIAPVLSAATVTSSLVSPQVVNKSIKLTAGKTGGIAVQYQFSISADNGATWKVLQAYSALTTYTWVPAVAGNYRLKVAARDGAAGTPVESAIASFTITPVLLASVSTGWAFQLIAHGDAGNAVVSIGETGAGPAVCVQAQAEAGAGPMLALEQPGVGALQSDLRAGFAPQEWHLVVKTCANRDTVLTWPDLRAVPRDVSLVLVDQTTGRRCAMRSAGMYLLPAARVADERRLTVIASRAVVAPLTVLGLRAAGTRGAVVHVTFTLTADARVTLTVRGVTGRVIRKISSAELLPAGEGMLTWDGRAEGGSAVPPGAYQYELLATDVDGRAIRAFTLGVTP